MVGATPEALLRSTGNSFETEALAGSAPRRMSAEESYWGKTLLGREKVSRTELVIQSILRRLSSIGINCKEGNPEFLAC